MTPKDEAAEAPKTTSRQTKIGFAIVAVCAAVALFWPASEDRAAPGGSLEDSKGGSVELESQLAPVTLIHFWSTWCPPCIAETPAIRRLAEDYADDPEFRLVMIAVADDVVKVGEFLGDPTATFYDPDWKVAKAYGTSKLPETHLVVGGQMEHNFVGQTDWDAPTVRARLEEAQAAARASAAGP